MDAYDLSHKLSFIGRHCPVPFITGPEFTNSVPGVPVLSSVRIFIAPEQWSDENILTIARDICRNIGPTQQFDVGITLAQHQVYDPKTTAAGNTARLQKLDHGDPTVILRLTDGNGDRILSGRFPRLLFEPVGEDFWRSRYAMGAVKQASQV